MKTAPRQNIFSENDSPRKYQYYQFPTKREANDVYNRKLSRESENSFIRNTNYQCIYNNNVLHKIEHFTNKSLGDSFSDRKMRPLAERTNEATSASASAARARVPGLLSSRAQCDDIQARPRGPGARGPQRRASREVTSTKEFEDRATSILAEMRRQRRSLKLENASSVSSVSSNLRTGGWRETMKKSASREEAGRVVSQTPPKQTYLGHKRSSISEFVGKVIRKLSVGKAETEQEQADTKPHFPAQFSNPLDFILMKEEYLKKNPPPPPAARQDVKRSQEPQGPDSMACVMDSLKKMVKKINPKREFAGDNNNNNNRSNNNNNDNNKEEIALRNSKRQSDLKMSQYEERMKKYQGASITPFNSHSSKWNSPGDNKMMRERIQSKVLSSLSQAQQVRLSLPAHCCDALEPAPPRPRLQLQPSTHWRELSLAVTAAAVALHTVEYRRADKVEMSDIIAQFNHTLDKPVRKKFHHAKLLVHGLNDPKGERYCYALVTRCGSAWATVRPINVAVKKKTELFAPKSRGRAHVSVDTLGVAVVTCPGTCGTTLAGPRHAPQDRGCALFSVVAAGGGAACVARAVVRAVLCLPVTAILDPDTDTRDQPVFCKCDRVPQSQLVQVLVSARMGTLSRISFHHPASFVHQDVVLTIARFTRTKKDLNRFKFKEEEFISRVVTEASSDDLAGKDGDGRFLSYGTV